MTALNITPLKKALSALRKCHDGIAEGQQSLVKMKQELSEALEKTDPSDTAAIRSLGELEIRVKLLPKFVSKSMEEARVLSQKLRDGIEPLWKELEQSLYASQQSFLDAHEKEVQPLFGIRSKEVLCSATAFPRATWTSEQRDRLNFLFLNGNSSGEIADDYGRDSNYDRQLCSIAEELLAIVKAYQS